VAENVVDRSRMLRAALMNVGGHCERTHTHRHIHIMD
jgi:hypothetical protein